MHYRWLCCIVPTPRIWICRCLHNLSPRNTLIQRFSVKFAKRHQLCPMDNECRSSFQETTPLPILNQSISKYHWPSAFSLRSFSLNVYSIHTFSLWYFREDIGVNLHHWHWHLVYPFEAANAQIVNKDRRGELFYYMHQQVWNIVYWVIKCSNESTESWNHFVFRSLDATTLSVSVTICRVWLVWTALEMRFQKHISRKWIHLLRVALGPHVQPTPNYRISIVNWIKLNMMSPIWNVGPIVLSKLAIKDLLWTSVYFIKFRHFYTEIITKCSCVSVFR